MRGSAGDSLSYGHGRGLRDGGEGGVHDHQRARVHRKQRAAVQKGPGKGVSTHLRCRVPRGHGDEVSVYSKEHF